MTAPSAHGTLMSVRLVQPENAVESMVVGVPLKVMEKIDSEVEIHPIAPPASRLGAGRL